MSVTRRGFLHGVIVLTGGAALANHLPPTTGPTLDPPAEAPLTCDDFREIAAHGMPTKLETFIKSRGIKPAHLARESGFTRAHLLRIRMGRLRPDARCMVAVTVAVRRLSREYVYAADLFGPAAIAACITDGVRS